MVLVTKEELPKLVLVSFPTRTRHWGRAGLDTCARHPGSLRSVRSPNGDSVSPEVVTARVNYYLPRPFAFKCDSPGPGRGKMGVSGRRFFMGVRRGWTSLSPLPATLPAASEHRQRAQGSAARLWDGCRPG